MNLGLVIAAIVAVIGDLLVTAYGAHVASKSRDTAADAVAIAVANRDLLNEVKVNGDDIKVVMDKNHDVLTLVHGFEEYQHARNHDIMNQLATIRGTIEQTLRSQTESQERMIELLTIIAQKGT